MNIQLEFDEEHADALADLVADYNANREAPVTESEYLETVIRGIVADRVKRNFQTLASSLVQAAESAPYAKRMDLVATVQAKLAE